MSDFDTGGILGVSYATIYAATSSSPYQYVDSYPPFKLGQVSLGSDGTQWVFVKFGTGGLTDTGYVCTFDEDFLAVMMSNSVGGLGDKIGIGQGVALVDNYGWLQVYGVADAIRVSASAAANVALASTVTAGELDDATGTGTKNISGIILTTARGGTAGSAPGTLNFPVIGSTN